MYVYRHWDSVSNVNLSHFFVLHLDMVNRYNIKGLIHVVYILLEHILFLLLILSNIIMLKCLCILCVYFSMISVELQGGHPIGMQMGFYYRWDQKLRSILYVQ